MIILVDYNLTGYIELLQGALAKDGWLELLSLKFSTLEQVGLKPDCNDQIIWRFVQTNKMLLITANRNAKGEDSLEQTIRREANSQSLPIITIANLDRLMEKDYRDRCGLRLVEVAFSLENYLGVGRIFIP